MAALKRCTMYPATAVPPGSVTAVHWTVTLLPATVAEGVLPAGMVVAAAAAPPFPLTDQVASAGTAAAHSPQVKRLARTTVEVKER